MINYNLLKYSAMVGMIPGVGRFAETMALRYINAQMFMSMVDEYMVASGHATPDELEQSKNNADKVKLPISEKLANLCDNFKNYFEPKPKSNVAPYVAMSPKEQIDYMKDNDPELHRSLESVVSAKNITDVMIPSFKEKYINDDVDYDLVTSDVIYETINNIGSVDPKINERLYEFLGVLYSDENIDIKSEIAKLNLDMNKITNGVRFSDEYLGNHKMFDVVDELAGNSFLSTLSKNDIRSLLDKIDKLDLPRELESFEAIYLLGKEAKNNIKIFDKELMFPHFMDTSVGSTLFFTNVDGKIYSLSGEKNREAVADIINNNKRVFIGNDDFYEIKANPMAVIAMNSIIREDGIRNEKFSSSVNLSARPKERLIALTDAHRINVNFLKVNPFTNKNLSDEYLKFVRDDKVTFGKMVDGFASKVKSTFGMVFEKVSQVAYNIKYGSIDYNSERDLNDRVSAVDSKLVNDDIKSVVDNNTVSVQTNNEADNEVSKDDSGVNNDTKAESDGTVVLSQSFNIPSYDVYEPEDDSFDF